MKGMENAVDRIQNAIAKGEQILLYGDYDVDGTTSTAMMYTFLQHLTPKISYIWPKRRIYITLYSL